MTCETIRDRILALDDPQVVPVPLRDHLESCAGCAAWWQGATRVEGLLARLPVPPASKERKADFLSALSGGGPMVRRATARTAGGSERAFDRRSLGYLVGLAASVALAVGAWALVRGPAVEGPGPQAARRHPLLDSIVGRNVALARAETPAGRMAALGGMADDIRGEVHDLARVASADELKALAAWYEKVVRDGVVKQAELLPAPSMAPADRAALLRELAGRLTAAADEADLQSKDAPPGAQGPLRRIAESARDGREKLHRIAGGGV